MVQQLEPQRTTSYLRSLAIDETLGLTSPDGTFFLTADALGSTVAISDGAGSAVNEYTYDPFGTVTATNPAFANPFQFTGRENDGLAGLYYYRARYYHSDFRRFFSEDPIGFDGGGPNLYAYVRNSPTRLVDPLGLQQVEPVDPVFGPADPRGCIPRCTTVGDVFDREIRKWEPVMRRIGETLLEGLIDFMCHRYRVECPTGPFPPLPDPSPNPPLPGFVESNVVVPPRAVPSIHGRKDAAPF